LKRVNTTTSGKQTEQNRGIVETQEKGLHRKHKKTKRESNCVSKTLTRHGGVRKYVAQEKNALQRGSLEKLKKFGSGLGG